MKLGILETWHWHKLPDKLKHDANIAFKAAKRHSRDGTTAVWHTDLAPNH